MTPVWARALWFVFIGWWLALVWISISLLLVVTVILAPFGLSAISKTWDVATLKTAPTTVVEEGKNQMENNRSGSNGSTHSIAGKEFFNISPNEFTYVAFSVDDDAKLEYGVEVHNGPNINTIVTHENNISKYRGGTEIGWVESASSVNVGSTVNEAVISRGDYAIILDNTGRFGGQEATATAEVTLRHRVTEST